MLSVDFTLVKMWQEQKPVRSVLLLIQGDVDSYWLVPVLSCCSGKKVLGIPLWPIWAFAMFRELRDGNENTRYGLVLKPLLKGLSSEICLAGSGII